MRTLLVPTDFSDCAERALLHAIDLARHEGARLHLLHVFALYEPDLYGEVAETAESTARRERLEALVRERLDDLVARHQPAGVALEAACRRSLAVAPTILAYADEVGADVVVMGTHGRRGVRHLLLGSVAEEVVKRAECDVLTVRETPGEARPGAVRRLLVPVDFSEHAPRVLRKARRLAAAYGASLDVLHVIEPFPFPLSWGGFGTLSDVVPDLRPKAERSLEQLVAEDAEPSVPARSHVVEGHPAAGIADFARAHDVDLIVMATHGFSGLERFFIGSVAERVVRTAPCPVYTIHAVPAAPAAPEAT